MSLGASRRFIRLASAYEWQMDPGNVGIFTHGELTMSPTVSVVLPTYNRAKTLSRAIDSVLAQTYTDYDLVIVDDGSKDDTASVLRPYADLENVRIIHQQNMGAAMARNVGIAATTGEYVAFQDSDDEWLPEKLEVAVDVLGRQSPQVDVFYSDMYLAGLDGSVSVRNAPIVKVGMLMDEAILDYAVTSIGIQAAVIRRTCFDRYGVFDLSLPRFIDLEMFLRLSERVNFHHEGRPLVTWHEGPGISTNKEALATARRYLLQKYRQQLSRTKWHLACQYYRTATAYADLRHPQEACRFAWKAVLACPSHRVIRHKSLDILTDFLPDPWGRVLRRLRRLRGRAKTGVPEHILV